MRTIAWCVLTLSLVGCHGGPRWCMRDCDTRGPAHYDEQPVIESAPQPAVPQPAQPPKEGPNLTPPPQPAQKERTPYESSSRSRGWIGSRSTSQASRSKSSSRTAQTARRTPTPAPTTKPAAQDDSVKQLLVDLEKTKREKSALETKLSEESAKQTQQHLELEARLALLQEQMRQQSALQQVLYQQQQASSVTNTTPNYSGPVITSGVPSPSIPYPFYSTKESYASIPQKKPLLALESAVTSAYQMPKYQPQFQNAPPLNNSASTWSNTTTGVWSNTAKGSPQQQLELWPYSPQRR